MKQEDKKLLINDLCARLPYKVMKQEDKEPLFKDFGFAWWVQFAIYLIGVCIVFGVLIINIINSL